MTYYGRMTWGNMRHTIVVLQWLALLAAVTIIVSAFGAFVKLIVPNATADWAPETLLISLSIFAAAFAAIKTVKRWKRTLADRFKKIFLLEEGAPRDQFHITLIQGTVNGRLRLLAERYAAACKNEENFLASLPTDIGDVRGAEVEIKHGILLHQKVTLAKQEFWTAHLTASRIGFRTYPKYRDYLDDYWGLNPR